MIRILLLLGFIFYSLPSLAKIVNAKVKYMHTGEISTNEGCELAKNRAKLKALEKVMPRGVGTYGKKRGRPPKKKSKNAKVRKKK